MTFLVPPIGVSANTWTPGITFGGGAIGVTYNGQSGWWTQTGNIVNFTGVCAIKTVGSSTGAAAITGLPVTSNSSVTSVFIIPSYFAVTLVAGNSPTAIITNSSTIISLYQQNGSYTALTNASFVANCQVVVSGFYFV